MSGEPRPVLSPFGSGPFLWGLYCACSWTWCIGLYLPVILIDRFGWPGFIVFAVPNVLGCVAFGFIVQTAARSRTLIQRHGRAMTLFSMATVAYHVFFWVWLLDHLILLPNMAGALPTGMAAALWAASVLMSCGGDRPWLALGAIVMLISLVTLALAGVQPLSEIGGAGIDPPSELAWLALPIAFGFLLCPYLDLTFHRALQSSGRRWTFAVFGAAFTIMIVLTCVVWPRIDEPSLRQVGLAHLLAQTVFTVGAHLREIRLSPALASRLGRALAMTLPLAALALLPAARKLGDSILNGEEVYLRFLVLYGLVFPAYVLMFMAARARMSRRSVLTWAVLVTGSLPLFELGFMRHQPWMSAAAIAAILTASLVMRSSTPPGVRRGAV